MSENSIRWFSTIRMKIVFVIIASCILVLGSLSTFNTIKEQQALSDDLNELAKVTAHRLSKHLIGPMWDLDKELVEDIIEAEMLEDRIYAIVISDTESSELFAASERGPDGRPAKSNGALSGDMIKASAIVNNGSKNIGDVVVFVSKTELDKKLTQSTLNGILTLMILIVVMVIIITMVMSRLIITPIKRLAKHADDISHGDLKQNIEPESNDEIGQLAEAFQRMQFSLRAAFKRLHNKTAAS